jgi:hypothetical protein
MVERIDREQGIYRIEAPISRREAQQRVMADDVVLGRK